MRHVEKALRVAYTVWNAVVLADTLGEDRYLADARYRLGISPAGLALVETLISRKRALFGDDGGSSEPTRSERPRTASTYARTRRDPYTVPRCRQQ